MRIVFVMCICVTGSTATCLTTLNVREREVAGIFPGRVVKWNRHIADFELIEAFNQNETSICSVDYIDDLTGKTIVISGEVLLPYLSMNPDKSLTGYIGDIWTTLETALKFRTDFRKARFSSGQTLLRGDIDEWLATIALTVRNNGHMVYSHQISANYYGLYAMSEGDGVPKWWYMNIFSRGLWGMSLGFVIGITGLLLVMYRLKRVVCRNYEECNNQLAIPSFNLLSVLGVMTGQGFQEIPNAWSLRFTILSAVIMGMLISCGFSSTLTSYLAIRGNTLHFNNLMDIVRAKTHTLCVRNNSNAHIEYGSMERSSKWVAADVVTNVTRNVHGINLKEANEDFSFNTHKQNMNQGKLAAMAKKDTANSWENLINKNCHPIEDTIEFRKKLCRPGVVYVEAPDVFLSAYTPIHHVCYIAQIPGEYWSSKISFLHARAARHRHLIDRYLLRLRSAGILHYLERKWISKQWPTSHERQLTFKTVEYAHVDLISLALVTMIFISGLICVLENIWFRLESRRARSIMAHSTLTPLDDFSLKTSNFPAAKLDATSRRLWTINVQN